MRGDGPEIGDRDGGAGPVRGDGPAIGNRDAGAGPMRGDAPGALRPAAFCAQAMATMSASEGRRRRRKRDTTPDAIGMAMKRELLEAVIADDPEPERFEEWLLGRCLASGPGSGGVHAMALSILEEWRFTSAADDFRAWLAAGAPSDDAARGGEPPGACALERR